MNRPNIDAGTTVLIAVLAFVLSYGKLVDLALRAGYDDIPAHLWPLIVDGLTVVATRGVMRLERNRYPWALLGAATVVSVAANIGNHLLPPGPLSPVAAATVSIVPPLCLLVAPHLAVRLMKADAPATEAVAVPSPTPPADAENVPEPEAPRLQVAATGDDRRNRALRLVAGGMSQRAAAREVGVTDTTVRRWIKAAAASDPAAA